jgi:hypothetical protein
VGWAGGLGGGCESDQTLTLVGKCRGVCRYKVKINENKLTLS